MPVEIHELVIRALVARSDTEPTAELSPESIDMEELVQKCVDETLRILRRERER